MSHSTEHTTVGELPDRTRSESVLPAVSTWLVWAAFLGSLAVLAWRVWRGAGWTVAGLVAVDGMTVLLWVVVTFFSGIVHSFSRRYMAGSAHGARFFATVLGFTGAVMGLVAADHLALFAACWLAMGLLMAELIGLVGGWEAAQAAARVARRSFLASSALLAVALGTIWWATGATTVSGAATSVGALGWPGWALVAGALLLAAMLQSALIPFHGWLLASMTAPTPASALMHAGFVNAGGILLLRFAPVVTADIGFMLLIVAVGATSAIGGKLLKSVQPDAKGTLGCSTVGQMGFMIVQAGLGFFAAAITHLVLHGCYKAYQFLGVGTRVEQTGPTEAAAGGIGVPGVAVTLLTGLAGGGLFALVTGKGGGLFAVLTGTGTSLDSGLLLALLVTVTVLHAAYGVARRGELPTLVRYGGVPLVALPAIAVYALVYNAIAGLLAGLPAVTSPTPLTPAHWLLAAAFLLVYVVVATGAHQRSRWLYVRLVNASQPPTGTLVTAPGGDDAQ
jgi:NAD(P)H-quinone oxidoreductase subunit 5